MIIPLSIAGYILLGYLLVNTYKLTSSALRIYFVPGLLLHILGGIGVGLIYQYYYSTGDTIQYFENAQIIKRWLSSNPDQLINFLFSNPGDFEVPFQEQPRALLMQKIVTVASYFGFNNYYFTSIYFSAVSFAALWSLADRLLLYYKKLIPILISFIILPVVVLWGSGILKESILVITIAVYVSALLDITKSRLFDLRRIIILLISLWIMYSIKYYYAAVIILLTVPLVLMIFFNRRLLRMQKGYVLLVLLLIVTAIAVPVSYIHPNLQYNNVMEVIINNNQKFIEKSEPDNIIHYKGLQPTVESFIINMPVALFSGLFRPLIFEGGNIFKQLVGAGNLVLLFLVLFAFPLKKVKDQTDFLLLINCCLYIAIMATFLSFSTPNFGTLSRYKVGYMPFFTFLILYNNRFLYWILNKLNLNSDG